jgi:glycosyltransferase involved in cell wall biosynthesis
MKQELDKAAPQYPKKVLFLITKATWGGAQRYVYDLATHLPRERFEAVVAFGQSGKLVEKLATAGVAVTHITDLGRDVAVISDLRSFFAIWKLLRVQKPDVIHLNSSKAAALGALAARLARVPRIIFTVHGWPFKEERGYFATRAIRAISWFTAILSHAVIVVSKEDEQLGTSMWGLEKKIVYIPLGIETPDFLSRDEASAILPTPNPSSPRIVTIAELTANKGIRFAIEAISQLKKSGTNVSYFIIGDGEERVSLETLVQTLHLNDCVHFLGFIPEASRYLKAFDMFLLPSVKEGMPYVLLEATAAGLPFITTTAVPGGTIEPGNARVIADAITKAMVSQNASQPTSISSLSEMIEKTTATYKA